MNIRRARKILDINRHTTIEKARSHFRELAREYHPDVTSLAPDEAASRFCELQAAWEMVKQEAEKEANKLKGGQHRHRAWHPFSEAFHRRHSRITPKVYLLAKVGPCFALHRQRIDYCLMEPLGPQTWEIVRAWQDNNFRDRQHFLRYASRFQSFTPFSATLLTAVTCQNVIAVAQGISW
jgi:hypothetical protein